MPEGNEGGVVGGGEGEVVAWWGVSGVRSGAVRQAMGSSGFEDLEERMGEVTDHQEV